MKSKFIKKTLIGLSVTLLLLVAILGIHIYVVTKPKADAHTVALARIDITQNIDEKQAGDIQSWLSKQPGVGHVLLNRHTDIIVFSFYPFSASADKITDNLKSAFNLNAERFKPSTEQLQSGCPALSHTFSGKVYTFFNHIFNHN